MCNISTRLVCYINALNRVSRIHPNIHTYIANKKIAIILNFRHIFIMTQFNYYLIKLNFPITFYKNSIKEFLYIHTHIPHQKLQEIYTVYT